MMAALHLRHRVPLIVSGIVFLVFAFVHASYFGPLARRYHEVLQRATALGMPIGPETEPVLPPSVHALLSTNALPAAEAERQAASGALTARMLGDLAASARRHGLAIVATEQGIVNQLPTGVQVHAHLELQGRYTGFVRMLDDLSTDGMLYAVDRFTIVSRDGHTPTIDLQVSRYVLKQDGATP